MATKLIKQHINVTAIAPGAFKIRHESRGTDHSDEVARRVPLRACRKPTRTWPASAIYLASRAGDYWSAPPSRSTAVVYANAGLELRVGLLSSGEGRDP